MAKGAVGNNNDPDFTSLSQVGLPAQQRRLERQIRALGFEGVALPRDDDGGEALNRYAEAAQRLSQVQRASFSRRYRRLSRTDHKLDEPGEEIERQLRHRMQRDEQPYELHPSQPPSKKREESTDAKELTGTNVVDTKRMLELRQSTSSVSISSASSSPPPPPPPGQPREAESGQLKHNHPPEEVGVEQPTTTTHRKKVTTTNHWMGGGLLVLESWI